MSKFGQKINRSRMKKGAPPLIVQLQPEGYIPLSKPLELKEWEAKVKALTGKNISATSTGGFVPCDTCSGGTADDCGMIT